ncbi:MAG: YggT family protein [Gemmatimonadota bacterium]|nr:YggT family protein [Gemmatimonadota bacterium]
MREAAYIVSTVLNIYGYLLLAQIIISWIRVNPYNHWIRLLSKLTEPFLGPFRRLIPPFAGVDFSPIVAFLVLNMIRTVVVRMLLAL